MRFEVFDEQHMSCGRGRMFGPSEFAAHAQHWDTDGSIARFAKPALWPPRKAVRCAEKIGLGRGLVIARQSRDGRFATRDQKDEGRHLHKSAPTSQGL